MEDLSKKKQTSEEKFQQAFLQDIHSGKSLIEKELIVISSEEILLKHRIGMLKEFIRNLPAGDPQYGLVVAAMEMDQIEIDSLEVRRLYLLRSLDTVE